jgi:hypothetical protein
MVMPTRLVCGSRLPARQFLTLALAAALLAGCGKGSGKKEVASDGQGEELAAATDADGDAPAKQRKSGSKKKASQGKTIKGIPIDVWPEVWLKDPLAVAAEKGPARGAAPAATGDSAPPVAKTDPDMKSSADAEKPAPASGAAPSGGSGEWTALISGEALADETKAIKNSLTQNLQDVGRYNSKWKDVKMDASSLAALAGVAIEHPEAPSWKTNAKYIRDTAAQIANESKANGEKFYTPAKKAYDRLDALLSGSRPPDVEEAADKVKFSEVANRYSLMKRLERTRDWMKSEINSEAAFKKESAKLSREAAVLALLGKVIQTPDYPDADADEYRSYAQTLVKSGVEIQEAVKNNEYKAFTESLDRSMKACVQCHMVFKETP